MQKDKRKEHNMKKTIYSCNICEQTKEPNQLMPYYINVNHTITFIEEKDIKEAKTV